MASSSLNNSTDYCSHTNCARCFRRENNNVDFRHVQPHYYRVRLVEPCDQFRCRPYSECHKALAPLFYSKLRKQENYVRVVVSPLWRGPGNIHIFILDRKSYRLLLKHQLCLLFPV